MKQTTGISIANRLTLLCFFVCLFVCLLVCFLLTNKLLRRSRTLIQYERLHSSLKFRRLCVCGISLLIH